MRDQLAKVLKLKIRYTYKRGEWFYYQRKIPIDLIQRFGNSPHVKENLETNDPIIAARKVVAWNRHYEDLWDRMRKDPSVTPFHHRDLAIRLLQEWDLKPAPHQNDPVRIDVFHDQFLDSRRTLHAGYSEDAYRESSPEEYLKPHELEAIRILHEPPKFYLSDALKPYLDSHKKAHDSDFREDNTRTWKRFVSAVGDKPFVDLGRLDVTIYINRLLAEGLKTGTVRRNLNTCSAIYRNALIEREIEKRSPFEKAKIPGEGTDKEEGEPFSLDQLRKLRDCCFSEDDDLRWALGMQMDLGSRIGEVVGLPLDDLVLDHKVPHVIFAPRPWRSIKTGEKRMVPLVGVALWAAQRIKASAKKDQFFAFPRYNNEGKLGKTKTDSASASLNKYLLSIGIDRTTHDLRHTMRDRLRNVNANTSIMDAIGGWGKQTVGDRYGKGYALEIMQDWLLKACALDK